MNEADRIQPYLAPIRHAHHQFQRMTGELGRMCSQGTMSDDGADQLIAHLRSLRVHLNEHFTSEEAGGYLEEAVIQAPHLAHQVTELEKQHPQLLIELDQLIATAERSSGDTISDLASVARHFAKQLIAHEAVENHILQSGFNNDFDLDL